MGHQVQEGHTHLEIFKEKGELMPRAVQTRDRSADGTVSLGRTHGQPIATRSGMTKVATC
jgi:hypothetical protein